MMPEMSSLAFVSPLARTMRHAEFGHHVFADVNLPPGEDAFTFPRGVAVAGDHDGEVPARLCEHVRVVQDAGLVATVRPANEQEDVRFFGNDLRGVVLGQLEGVGPYDLCTCAEACAFCRFRREFRHEAACDHSEAARGARAGVALRKIELARLLFKQGNGVCKAVVHVRLHGGVRGGGA